MKKDIAKVFLRTLLLVSMLSLSFPIGETVKPSSSESLCIAGKVVEVSPGNTTIHYVYFDFTEGRFEPFLLFNITVSEPGWYYVEIWIDMFNPSDEREGLLVYVCENKGHFIPRMLRPYLIHWPIDMIEFLITDDTFHLGTFVYTWGPHTLFLSAHEYREYAKYVIVDFEAVKPGIVECYLWDTSEFFLEMLLDTEPEPVDIDVTEVRVLDEDEASELQMKYFPEPPQPPNEFDIVVYANGTAT